MDEILNVFDNDAFGVVTLSQRVSRFPFIPMRLNTLGIFETKGVRTTEVAIEEQNGNITLIPYTDRDAPDNNFNGGTRRTIKFESGHFPLKRLIRPGEIQDVKSWSEGDILAGLQEVVDDKVKEMIPSHSVTLEYQRLGALNGIILDSDGSTIKENLYQRLGVTPKVIHFDLSNPATKVRIKCLNAKRAIEAGLGGATYEAVRALCGSEFFNKLISHPDVEKAYERWAEGGQVGAFLRSDPRFIGFEFGGIIWEEYRGSVNGIDFFSDEECRIYPVGVPGMYITNFSPANMMQFVNTKGLPLYSSLEILKHGRGVEVLTESDPISLCTRPSATVKGDSAAS